MNIVTNNCLGGFIYRDILKCEYKNPFIWTGIETEQFIDLVDNFKNIDFDNVMIEKDGPGFKNNFKTIIDDKYIFRNGHIIFSAKDKSPRIAFDNKHLDWVNVYYQKPWEYILEKYQKRVKRMDDDIRIAFYHKDGAGTSEEQLNRLVEVCKKHRYKSIIFTEKQINGNEYVKVIYIKHKEHWINTLFEQCKNEIEEFVK